MKGKIVQMPQKIEDTVIQGDEPQIVKDRGYSLLQIAIKIVGDRAIDISSDVSMMLDGKPLKGVGKLEVSMIPPYFGLTIVDEKEFQNSINEAGFFYAHGFVLSKLLVGKNYPSVRCATCAEKGREGWLKLEYGGMCSNKECEYAYPSVKAQKIQVELQNNGEEQETSNNPLKT